MLTELFHNRLVLYANGRKGAYRQALKGADRWRFHRTLQVAFKLALAVGLIKDKYVTAQERSLNLRIGENMVKIRKIALVLEQLTSEGWIAGIRDGKIFFSAERGMTRKDLMGVIMEGIRKIKGYGPIEAREFQNQKVWEMLVPEGKGGYWQKAGHFMSTWGLYNLLINWAAKDAACAKVLCEHKKEEAELIGPNCPVFQPDRLINLAEAEARGRDIERIKHDLQADNQQEIPPLTDVGGAALPPLDFVISDLHLREYHHENTEDILRFLWMVKRLNGRLILAGDTFDVWRAGSLDRCWTNNSRIVNALTKLREVVLIAGNHDEFLNVLARRGGIFANPRIKVVDEFVTADKRLKIFHGHQFDKFNRPGSWLGRAATRAVTGMEMSWLRRFLAFLNRQTSNKLRSLANFFGFLFGPQLSERLLLLPKLILPGRYTRNRQVANIIDWLDDEVDTAVQLHRVEPTLDRPLTFVIGHIHFAGISFLAEQLTTEVNRRYEGRVQLIVTDAWTNNGGFIGDYVVLSGDYIRKQIWWQAKGLTFATESILG